MRLLLFKRPVQIKVYLEHGAVAIDNSLAERAIKPFVIGRKTGCSQIAAAMPKPAPCCTA
ncbi:MAG: transposase [Candidatus Oceanisphaera merdipullorum]|nr:transposase [Candidatus Oceanisphaera merdipullorum]